MAKIRNEVKVGIFAFVTLAGLYWGVNFLRGQDLFKRNNTYYATYEQVNGIQKSSAIVIKGFKVGVISDITYDPQRSDKIVLEFSIKSKYKIPDNSKARIYSDGLIGGKAVEIELGTSGRYLQNRDTLRSEMDKGLFELAGSELEFLKQRVNGLINDMTVTLANVNTLLENNTTSLTTTMTNLSQITGSLNSVFQAETGTLRDIITNLNSLSATLKNSSGNIENIIANVEGFTESLNGAEIEVVIGNLTETLDEFNGMLAGVNAGEGTLGKLVSDDELYEAFVEAAGNLARLLDDVKAHPGRYVNISVFGGRNK